MPLQIKALIVVLVLTTLVFALSKPIALRFMESEDFARRRGVWLLLTLTSFVTPTFWLYLLIAVPLLLWAAHRDSNPLSLFLLLVFVIPPMDIEIPIVGINRLFELNNWRLLGFCVILPATVAWLRQRARHDTLRLTTLDALLLLFGLMQLLLLIPYESWTNSLRRSFLFLLDVYLVFFAFSRLLGTRRALQEAIATMCLVAAIFAPIAIFESMRGWLLYTEIGESWGFSNRHAWLFRGDDLRAQGPTGHSLTLGFIMALALGAWMYLRSFFHSRPLSFAVITVLATGLLVSYSRGPWLAAALLIIIFLAISADNTAAMLKSLMILTAMALVFFATPMGSAVMDTLPFVGSKGQETIAYRQQLAETSWMLIQQNPLLGNPFVLLEMEHLRQGQGIVDLVNAYAQVALFYGLIGFVLFSGVLLLSVIRGYSHLRRARVIGDADGVRLGAALLACAIANMVFIATAGNGWPQWVLAGMLAGYANLAWANVHRGIQTERDPATLLSPLGERVLS